MSWLQCYVTWTRNNIFYLRHEKYLYEMSIQCGMSCEKDVFSQWHVMWTRRLHTVTSVVNKMSSHCDVSCKQDVFSLWCIMWTRRVMWTRWLHTVTRHVNKMSFLSMRCHVNKMSSHCDMPCEHDIFSLWRVMWKRFLLTVMCHVYKTSLSMYSYNYLCSVSTTKQHPTFSLQCQLEKTSINLPITYFKIFMTYRQNICYILVKCSLDGLKNLTEQCDSACLWWSSRSVHDNFIKNAPAPKTSDCVLEV